jgi:secretion/DNA translocation related TadE-like protein
MDPRRDDERGSVSILTAVAAGMAVVVSLLVLDLWRAALARQQAQTAADASALAAAGAMASPFGGSPADAAADLAARNQAELVACACDPARSEAVVTVRVRFGLLVVPGGSRTVTASARAVVEAGVAGDGGELRGWFAARVSCLARLVPGIVVVSGFRTHQEQARLYREKPDLAAPPGSSLHELGLAADLSFPSPAARQRAHAVAASCGLGFEVSGEPWHAAPLGWE